MGRAPSFRRRKRGRGRRGRETTWGEAWRSTRPAILLIFAVTIFALWREPALVGVPDVFATEPQRVEARWSRCGENGRWAHYCVVDGDTFAIGSARYRVLGIDTAETKARCEREARLAEAATLALVDWLNAGPFWMRGRRDEPTDRYGRALRELYRKDEAGRRAYVGDALIGAGLARRYYGGGRGEWCLGNAEE